MERGAKALDRKSQLMQKFQHRLAKPLLRLKEAK